MLLGNVMSIWWSKRKNFNEEVWKSKKKKTNFGKCNPSCDKDKSKHRAKAAGKEDMVLHSKANSFCCTKLGNRF